MKYIDKTPRVRTIYTVKEERNFRPLVEVSRSQTVPHDTLEPREIIDRYTKGCNLSGMLNVQNGEPSYDTAGHGFTSLEQQEVLMEYPVPNIGMDLTEIEALTKDVKAKKQAYQKAVAEAAASVVQNS